MKNSAKYFYPKQNRIAFLYVSGVLILLITAFAGIFSGSTSVSLSDMWLAFTEGPAASAGARIFTYVRLPRTIASLLCGGALAVSGAVIQKVLANKLASPSIIGVNSGAGLAVTVATALGIYGGLQLSIFAFIGAFAAVMIVSLGAKKWNASRGTVILIGVAINSLLGAVSDTIVTFVPEVGVMSNDFKVGEFSFVTFQKLIPAAVLISVSLALLLTLHNELHVITLGEDTARSLGMNTSLMRTLFLLLAALLAGCSVSLAGLLSFVGLLVPHAINRITDVPPLHHIGLSALYGSSFVCLCDTVARTAFSPYEIPVGIIMSFFGAPFFIFILIKGKGGHADDRA